MPTTYEKQAATAQRLIKKFGQSVTFYTVGGTEYDDFGNETTTTGETVTGDGAVFGYSANQIDGTTIQSQDAYVLYYGDKPDNDMLIDHGGRTWTVVNSDVLQPTSAVILYKVQIR